MFKETGEKIENPEVNTEYYEKNVEITDKIIEAFNKMFEDDYADNSDKATENKDKKEASEQSSNMDGKEKLNEMFEDDYDQSENNVEETQDENLDNNENPEYDEDGTRKLTEEEKQMLKEKLGWSDKQIEQKCRIDENGVIHYKCDKEVGNSSGVEYEKKVVTINGVKIEVEVPKFNSEFDADIPESMYKSSNTKQFKECNKQLKEAIANDPELKKQFTKEQLDDIEKGHTPRGYTWHHDAEPGKMQLVKTEDHDRRIGGAAHTGGKALWGGQYGNKAEKNKDEGVTL